MLQSIVALSWLALFCLFLEPQVQDQSSGKFDLTVLLKEHRIMQQQKASSELSKCGHVEH